MIKDPSRVVHGEELLPSTLIFKPFRAISTLVLNTTSPNPYSVPVSTRHAKAPPCAKLNCLAAKVTLPAGYFRLCSTTYRWRELILCGAPLTSAREAQGRPGRITAKSAEPTKEELFDPSHMVAGGLTKTVWLMLKCLNSAAPPTRITRSFVTGLFPCKLHRVELIDGSS